MLSPYGAKQAQPYTLYSITFFCQKTILCVLETNNFKCTAVDIVNKLIFHQFSHWQLGTLMLTIYCQKYIWNTMTSKNNCTSYWTTTGFILDTSTLDEHYMTLHQCFPIFFRLALLFLTNKFLSPPTILSTHINTTFSYCIFGMFKNDQNKNECKDTLHYKTYFGELTHLAVGNC